MEFEQIFQLYRVLTGTSKFQTFCNAGFLVFLEVDESQAFIRVSAGPPRSNRQAVSAGGIAKVTEFVQSVIS